MLEFISLSNLLHKLIIRESRLKILFKCLNNENTFNSGHIQLLIHKYTVIMNVIVKYEKPY